jgi:hypothetical protein
MFEMLLEAVIPIGPIDETGICKRLLYKRLHAISGFWRRHGSKEQAVPEHLWRCKPSQHDGRATWPGVGEPDLCRLAAIEVDGCNTGGCYGCLWESIHQDGSQAGARIEIGLIEFYGLYFEAPSWL